MHRIKKMKETLINWLECEISKGVECFDVEAAGEVTDMIKDLAETEEKCTKAAYYSTIMDAMEGSEEHAKRYGYDNWRYSSGRFAPKGSGHYEGYTPMRGNVYVHDPNMDGRFRMGYDSNSSSNKGNSQDRGTSSNRYGYQGDREWSNKGMTYDSYVDAKRHYHDSGKSEDLAEMNKRMGENLSNVVMQVKEMSEDASPEMKRKLKMEMSSLMEDLNKMV